MHKKPYLVLYIAFLSAEIPNIIQILGFPTLFGIFLKRYYLSSYMISLATGVLIWSYFSVKMFEFLKGQLIDPHSYQNRHKLDDVDLRKCWRIYSICTVIPISIVQTIVIKLEEIS